jgi:hypothetical protein
MFSKGWGSSISLETVTPSLVIRGAPKVAAARPQRRLDGLGELREPVGDLLAGLGFECELFGCHFSVLCQ